MLIIKDVFKSYSLPGGGKEEVLKGVSMELDEGGSIAITGPSGSGKSTLLNMIGTLDSPDSGDVIFDGRNISSLSQKEKYDFRLTKLGFIFQEHYLLPQFSVVENILLPTIPMPAEKRRKATARALELLAALGMEGRKTHLPWQLSTGEKQRVAVARSLINRPRLVLADEPTGSLDQAKAEELADLLMHMNKKENVALVIVTHSEKLAGKTESVFRLSEGKLAGNSTIG